MEMNPQRIRDVEFKSVRKGIDPAEVREFLNDVADELERAQNQAAAMEARARAAVARLQEVSEQTDGTDRGAPAAVGEQVQVPVEPVVATVDESETISRTLLLAQRTADTAIAEARADAARIVRAANDEAATTLDSTREMAAQLVVEARVEARQAGESERVTVAGEVDSLKARRDFLESDVEQLEIFLTDQRSRIRESATSLLEITERIPGGLGEARRPLLSASHDPAHPDEEDTSAPPGDSSGLGDLVAAVDAADTVEDAPWSDERQDPTTAMPTVNTDRFDSGEPDSGDLDSDNGEAAGGGVDTRAATTSDSPSSADGDFRFSFDDDRN